MKSGARLFSIGLNDGSTIEGGDVDVCFVKGSVTLMTHFTKTGNTIDNPTVDECTPLDLFRLIGHTGSISSSGVDYCRREAFLNVMLVQLLPMQPKLDAILNLDGKVIHLSIRELVTPNFNIKNGAALYNDRFAEAGKFTLTLKFDFSPYLQKDPGISILVEYLLAGPFGGDDNDEEQRVGINRAEW